MKGFEKLFDDCAEVAAPLDEQALKAIPAKRGVFALLADDGKPILITTAADIRSRLRYRLTSPDEGTRTKAADLREITAKVCWRLTYSRFETDWLYLEIVRQVWPDTYADLLPKRTAWFVSIDQNEDVPDFRVVAGRAGRGRSLGPFPDRKSAERFIHAIVDAFDLCRCVSVLRQTPRGAACAYKQMGRCDAPCDGSSSMADYRDRVARAVEFAAGDRQALRNRLTDQMKRAAEAMQFEQAAAVKARLERLDEFQSARFGHIRDLDEFQFVIIQTGPAYYQASSFVCDRGAIEAGPIVDFPPTESQLADVLNACDRCVAGHVRPDEPGDSQRMGLVAWYLFSGKVADGLVLPRRQATPGSLCEAIVQAATDLKFRPQARKKPKADQPEGSGATENA